MNKMISGFRVITDTGPVHAVVWGKTMQELFQNCMRAMTEIMKPTILHASQKAKKITKAIRVEAIDLNTLLIEFLSEVIRLSDVHDAIFTESAFKKMGDDFLEGELSGEETGGIESEIKAVSYQDVEIIRNAVSGLYETTLVFEI